MVAAAAAEPLNPRAALFALVFLAVAAATGVAAAAWPVETMLAVAALAVLGVPVVVRVAHIPISRLAVIGLLTLHFLSILRATWFDVEFVPFFDWLRLPAMALVLAVVVGGGLMTLPASNARRPALLLGCYSLWILVAGQWGLNAPVTTFYGAWIAAIFIVIILAVASVDDPSEFWTLWLQGLIVVGAVLLVACLIANLSGSPFARSDRWVEGTQRAGFCGIFVNPNVMGGLATVTAAASLASRLLMPDRPTPRWLLPLILLCGVLVVSSLSRGSLVGYIAALGWFGWRSRASLRNWRRTTVGAAAAVFALVLMASTMQLGDSISSRLASTTVDSSSPREGRLHIWGAFARHARQHPIVGAGFSNSPMHDDYISIRLAGAVRSSHSAVLMYMVAPGLPGGLLIAVLLGLGWRRLRERPVDPLGRSVGMLIIGLAPTFLFMSSSGPASWGPFSMWVPLVFAASLAPQHERHPRRAPQLPPRRPHPGLASRWNSPS